eukprot:CAMPEP_0119038672 /NCGR_PEP_ID=MMETSP1177-20130426/7733_1 /TAXON_ID=2985 /ORGANISM="Ochromonas sp, Strain CCMP1899" /LENGTH=65 /DNA_ID=CAMNT_0007001563 /DNA_START=718 /DNA_END=911 /DNA_ORIENTATION=+
MSPLFTVGMVDSIALSVDDRGGEIGLLLGSVTLLAGGEGGIALSLGGGGGGSGIGSPLDGVTLLA